MTKKVVQMQKKKKDTFFETHFGNSKLGIDKAAKQEFSFQNEFCGRRSNRYVSKLSAIQRSARSRHVAYGVVCVTTGRDGTVS
jgi:hypothetical protein